MADPKKNPLIGAFRAPVPGAPPDTPAPPEAGKPPAAGAAKPSASNTSACWGHTRNAVRETGRRSPCGRSC